MTQRNPGLVVAAALLSGFLLGTLATAYLMLNWVPKAWQYRDSIPSLLAYGNPAGTTDAQRAATYRDFYVAAIAARYERALTGPERQSEQFRAAALKDARTQLGVTTGDATSAEAADMVKNTFELAKRENDDEAAKRLNRDGGWFSNADETGLSKLATELNNRRTDNVPNESAPRETQMFGKDTWLGWFSRFILPFILFALLLVGFGLLFQWLISQLMGTPTLPAERAPILDEADDFVDDHAAPYASGEGEPETTLAPEAERPPGSRFQSTPVQPAPTRRLEPAGPDVEASYPIGGAAAATRTQYNELGATQDDANQTNLNAPVSSALSAPHSLGTVDYIHGEDNFDEDFDITGPKGLLVGTCGASIAERIGMTQPSSVNALLISVFDKAAFKTTSKVLVVPGVLNNPLLKRKLSEKGELITALPGEEITIDTQTLRVLCKVNTLDINDETSERGHFKRAELSFVSQQRQ